MLLYSPPGTGKTYVIIRLAKYAQARGRRILICATTNTAVDEIGRRLKAAGIDYTRVGREDRVDPDLKDYALYSKAKALLTARDVPKAVPARTAEWNRAVTTELQTMESSGYIDSESPTFYRDAVRIVMTSSSVVLTTLSTSASWEVSNTGQFDMIIEDEAAQTVLPESLIPLSTLAPGGRFVLIGGKQNNTAAFNSEFLTYCEQTIDRWGRPFLPHPSTKSAINTSI